ncbi:MAG: MmcB family DNA repair protein, partial [Pseudomonadota bacterium]|nr:MmcB family DNA repair protein [Pseudomonadota bacterium]
KSGRRVDLIALDRKGIVTVVEIKSSVADYRSDKKWHEYLEYCDRFFFAVAADFPLEMLPETCGVILADGFGASVLREPPEGTFNAARRKALMLRFARTSAARLHKYIDPEWIRG